MADATNRFVLKFHSDIGKVVRISIPRARTNKTTGSATASMQAIIANGAVAVAGRGIPAAIKGAKLITTERITLI